MFKILLWLETGKEKNVLRKHFKWAPSVYQSLAANPPPNDAAVEPAPADIFPPQLHSLEQLLPGLSEALNPILQFTSKLKMAPMMSRRMAAPTETPSPQKAEPNPTHGNPVSEIGHQINGLMPPLESGKFMHNVLGMRRAMPVDNSAVVSTKQSKDLVDDDGKMNDSEQV